MTTQDDNELGRLVKKLPRLFHGKAPPWSDLPAGWVGLVDELCADIDSVLTDDAAAAFEVTQIKEKFGGLRFYVRSEGEEDIYIDAGSNEGRETIVRRADVGPASVMPPVRELVEAAMRRSTATCVTCGEQGQTDTFGGWVATLCERHAAERRGRKR
jgi:hypothetical protein